jgi:hypothetical protein
MEKLEKFFITTLVAGLVAFSSVLVLPTQVAQAHQIADNAITSPKIMDGEVKTQDLANGAVTKEKLNPTAVKLVIERRTVAFPVPPGQTNKFAYCLEGELVTGEDSIQNQARL